MIAIVFPSRLYIFTLYTQNFNIFALVLITGVVIVFWLLQETNNQGEDIKKLLNEAETNQLKIAFCIEAFSNSGANDLFKNIHFITNNYSTHPAFYKLMKNGRYLPVRYSYNSYINILPT